MRREMKLLFVLPEYLPQNGGGIITFYRMLLPELARAGHQVKVLVGSGVVAEFARPPVAIDGVSVEMLDVALLEAYHARFARYAATPGLRRHLAAAWALREQARNGDGVDLVESTDWGLLFLPWVMEDGPPALVQLHGSCGQIDVNDPVAGEELQGELIRLLEVQALARADCLQTYSDANADAWTRQLRARVDCILPAWKPLHDTPNPVRRSGRGLVVGRVQKWKGPHVLCAALRLLGDRAPFIEWIGRDTRLGKRGAPTSDSLAQAYPDIWNVRLIHRPQLPPDQVANAQAAAAFAVVPSTWDMFNLTAVEAMAAGTPVICSTGAGASQLVRDGVNGFVFGSGDAEALAAAIERCLALTPDERARLTASAGKTIREELDPRANARVRVERYREIGASRKAQAPAGDWLRRACAPEDAPVTELAFLDHLPLSPLARYVWRRALERIHPEFRKPEGKH
jgi:glycosyltransferase involved in cell wall biosynthesis